MEAPKASIFSGPKPVAIVGIATQFPSGSYSQHNLDHDQFFKFLLEGGQAYEKIPKERFNIDSWKGAAPGQIISEKGAFLKDLSMFDHLEFGVNFRDARSMAVSTRKLIELAFLALLDSGIEYRGRNVGCFMSGIAHDISSIADADEFDVTGSFAGGPFMVANKVSYHLDLLGPSLPTDTACSASLSALHLAVQAIRAGDCESAVVGGCQVNHRFIDWFQYSQGSVLAPDGMCKPFDASANGFSRGEGAAVVVVKLLEDALRDGDRIYATILGTAINSNGSAAPVSTPLADGQADAMRRAYVGLTRRPHEADFVEMHATGTAVGDPVEANWVGKEFGRDEELLVGSVKGNTGHLEIAAFLASLSKVCSIFKHGVIPPNVNLHTPNPSIRWKEYSLRVPLEPIPLRRDAHRRPLVSICSSGIGGVNGHAVIEGPPLVPPYQTRPLTTPVLLLAGGLSPRTASLIAEGLDRMASEPSFDIAAAATIQGRRCRSMTWKSFSIRSPDRSVAVKFSQPALTPRVKPPLVFVLSGQGPQHFHMGRQLFETYPAFRDSIIAMDKVYEAVVGQSLMQSTGIFSSASPRDTLPSPWPIETILPAIAMLQIGLVDLLRAVGFQPDAVVGHSAGETAMLYASGACSRVMALEIAIARGKAMSMISECGGGMAALGCPPEEAQSIIAEIFGDKAEGKVEIACFNASDAVALAGSEIHLDAVLRAAEHKGILARKIRTSIPVHSSLMEGCHAEYVKLVEEVFGRFPGRHAPKVPTFSTVAGSRWTSTFEPDYMWQGARQPVLFEQAMASTLAEFPTAHFLEISAHPVLASYISTVCPPSTSVFCPMRRSKAIQPYDEALTLLKCIGRLSLLGCGQLDISVLSGCRFASLDISLPPYPFNPKQVPYYPQSSKIVARQMQSSAGPLSRPGLRLSVHTHRDLAEHIIRGEPIMPAAGFLEMAFEHGARVLRKVHFRSMMPLLQDKTLHVDFHSDGNHWKISSRLPDRSDAPHKQNARLHANGLMSTELIDNNVHVYDIEEIRSRCFPLSASKLYTSLAYFAQYGPLYQRVLACWRNGREALALVRGMDKDLTRPDTYIFHPAILDACLHVAIHPAFTGQADRNIYYLPSRVKLVTLHKTFAAGQFPGTVYAYVVFRTWHPDCMVMDISILDDGGKCICTMSGFELARHIVSIPQSVTSSRYDIIYQATSYIVDCQKNRSRHVPEIVGRQTLVVTFLLGHELDLQSQLRDIDLDRLDVLWMQATSNIDVAAARGFSRSLRKELTHVDVRFISFDAVWSPNERAAIIDNLCSVDSLEQEIHVDSFGHVCVPRLVALPSPTPDAFNPHCYWVNNGDNISQPVLPWIGPNQVLVHVSSCFRIASDLMSFVGTVSESRSGYPATGAPVVGLTSAPLSNSVLVHEGCLLQIHEGLLADGLPSGSVLLAALIVTMAVGQGAVGDRKRMEGKQILVACSEGPLLLSIKWVLASLGLCASSVHSITSFDSATAISKSNIIITGAQDPADIQYLRSMAPASCRIYIWDDSRDGLHRTIESDPWLIGDAFKKILPILPSLQLDISGSSFEPSQYLPPGASVNSSALFDSQKVYLLVGGIGSLGIQCAMWMYENGARHIVLTSRSGKQSLLRTNNIMALRILEYLENLPDLTLCLESGDAASQSDMRAIFSKITQSLRRPLAGVIFMGVVFSDLPFLVKHTQETYPRVFPSKTGAFEVLRAVYPIEDLDFLISISSVTIFGNPGQTNYSSANAALDEMLRPYRNTFSLVSPAILDTSTIATDEDLQMNKLYAYAAAFSVTCRQVCECLGDGIRLMRERKLSLYIPDCDWALIQYGIGSSPMYNHLVPETVEEAGETESEDLETTLRKIILTFLDVEPSEFLPEVPFTAYGLDSLTAGRLALAIKKFIVISSVQLLADISFSDLLARIQAQVKN